MILGPPPFTRNGLHPLTARNPQDLKLSGISKKCHTCSNLPFKIQFFLHDCLFAQYLCYHAGQDPILQLTTIATQSYVAFFASFRHSGWLEILNE